MPGQSQSATLPRYTSNDSPPPAYYLPSHQKLQPRDSSAQLRRYLIELVAYTFQADFGQLNNILNPGRRVSPDQYFISILTDDEKTDLKRLAHSTSELQLMALRRRWSTTMKRERDSILESIVKPAKDLELSPPYILDMISTQVQIQF
ncbi:hypothetical protein BDV96DRAFT_594408 [Lophiotrema nucula]|uniref:Uncharacterized protein n=1 Tax=Lophiotrema nucula TaxID=690887 RepID=A0A6A5ZSG0_9PLEO|nr:hypothetical protein BDV96DRAFT_594408 [Lophiotrema nucula]